MDDSCATWFAFQLARKEQRNIGVRRLAGGVAFRIYGNRANISRLWVSLHRRLEQGSSNDNDFEIPKLPYEPSMLCHFISFHLLPAWGPQKRQKSMGIFITRPIYDRPTLLVIEG